MTDPRAQEDLEFIAELLRAEAAPIARRAARALIEVHPDVARRWGAVGGQADRAWAEALENRVLDLAAAVEAGRPELLGLQLAWALQAFRARGIPPADLTRSMLALEEAVCRTIPADDAPLLRPYFAAATAALEAPAADPPAQVSAETPEGRLAAGFLAAVLGGDRRAACGLVLAALRDGSLTPPDAHTLVLGPALREMGRMWHLGEVNVAEEHFATATALTLMSQVLALWDHAPPNGLTVLCASVEGNSHEIGARMVADFFEAAGWRAISLGASVPAADLASAAADYRADVVALSVMLSSQIPAFRETCRLVRVAAPAARILAGGAGLHDIPALALENGAHAFARTPAEAVSTAAALVPPR